MKRAFLFIIFFAVVVVPLDLQGEDPLFDDSGLFEPAEDIPNEPAEGEGGVAPSETPSVPIVGAPPADADVSAELRDRLRVNIEILRDTSKRPDEREIARDTVQKVLTEMFDADVARRREKIEKLRSQLSKLTTQLDAREKSRDEMVNLRLLLLDQEISGDRAFPQEWNILSELTGSPSAMPSLSPITNSMGMKLVHVPKGELTAEDRRVGVTDAIYFLGQTEVTQGGWKAVMKTEPWKGQEGVKEGDGYPATFVWYEDAVRFCERLSAKDERAYRLPRKKNGNMPVERVRKRPFRSVTARKS